MKIRPLGADLFQTDGRTNGETDTTKLIVALRNLRTRLKMSGYNLHIREVPDTHIGLDTSYPEGEFRIVNQTGHDCIL